MEVVVTEASRREAVEGRRLDRATEGAGTAESDVVDQDDDDVGGILGSRHLEAGRRFRVPHVQFAVGRSFGLQNWQGGAIELLLCGCSTAAGRQDEWKCPE